MTTIAALRPINPPALSATLAPVYTVPAGKKFRIWTLSAVLVGDVPSELTLHLVPSGGAESTGVLVRNMAMQQRAVRIVEAEGLVMMAGDRIFAKSSSAGQIVLHLSGAEIA